MLDAAMSVLTDLCLADQKRIDSAVTLKLTSILNSSWRLDILTQFLW